MSPILQMGNGGTERVNNLWNVTQLKWWSEESNLITACADSRGGL